MVFWIVPPHNMIEPIPAPEFYIDADPAIEKIGSCVRYHCAARQLPLEAGIDIPQSVVMVKLVQPICMVPGIIGLLAQCIDAERSPNIHRSGPRLVR